MSCSEALRIAMGVGLWQPDGGTHNTLLWVLFQMLGELACDLVYLVFGTINSFVHAAQDALNYRMVCMILLGKLSNRYGQQTESTSNSSTDNVRPTSIHVKLQSCQQAVQPTVVGFYLLQHIECAKVLTVIPTTNPTMGLHQVETVNLNDMQP